MTKKKRRRPSAAAPPGPAPKVHVKVVVAGGDLRVANPLVKPAVLYADDVTIYSPAASMLNAVRGLNGVTDFSQQLALILAIAPEVPAVAEKLNITDDQATQLRTFATLDRRMARKLGAAHGVERDIAQAHEMLDNMSDTWQRELVAAFEASVDKMGAGDLVTAVDAGAVKIADVGVGETASFVADALRASTGDLADSSVQDILATFMTRVVEILGETRTYPLLDAESTGLVQALEREAGDVISSSAVKHGAEAATATSLMGFLPYFPELPMDEVLDLRRELRRPLVRFRAALADVTREFQFRPIDADFDAEVRDLWVRQVAPALADIREALAEHGLLRESASIALGNPSRLAVEAGGVVAAGHGNVLSLSNLLMAALASALPLADITGRALMESRRERTKVRSHAFYFLHALDRETRRRATS